MNDLKQPKKNLGLCLSGGGYRATLFQLGSLIRLNELGILAKVDTISSVSGGSLLALIYADFLMEGNVPDENGVFSNLDPMIRKVRELVRRDLRTVPVLNRIKPNFLFNSSTLKAAVRRITKSDLIKNRPITELSKLGTKFIFNATDLNYSIRWTMSDDKIGSYRAGYLRDRESWSMAECAMISANFPPVFPPVMPKFRADMFVASEYVNLEKYNSPTEQRLREKMALTDGGAYDNLGTEPIFNTDQSKNVYPLYENILIIDGGAPFEDNTSARIFGKRLFRYIDVARRQSGSLRRRLFYNGHERKEYGGAYWGLHQWVGKFSPDAEGYTEKFAQSYLRSWRTDIAFFSDDEIDILVKHGYELADVVVKKYAKDIVMRDEKLQHFKDGLKNEALIKKQLPNPSKLFIFNSKKRREVSGSESLK